MFVGGDDVFGFEEVGESLECVVGVEVGGGEVGIVHAASVSLASWVMRF